MEVVQSSAEHQAMRALSVIAKMTQWITYYEKMLDQQKLNESVPDEVQEELAHTTGAEAEAVGFSRAKVALGLYGAKWITWIRQKRRRNPFKRSFGWRKVSWGQPNQPQEASDGDFQWLEQQNAELKAQVVKGESRIAKLKDALKIVTKSAVEKYTEGFCLTLAHPREESECWHFRVGHLLIDWCPPELVWWEIPSAPLSEPSVPQPPPS